MDWIPIAIIITIGSFIGSIILNIFLSVFANIITNPIQDWYAKRSIISSTKKISKLKHNLARIEKYHNNPKYFYGFVFFNIIGGISLIILLNYLTFLFVYSTLHRPLTNVFGIDNNTLQQYIQVFLFYICAFITLIGMSLLFFVSSVIQSVSRFDEYKKETENRIAELATKKQTKIKEPNE